MSGPEDAAVQIVRGGVFVAVHLTGRERFRLPAIGPEEAEDIELLPAAWRRRLAAVLRPLQWHLRRWGIPGLPPMPPPWFWIPQAARPEIRAQVDRAERRLAGLREEMAAAYPELLREAARRAEAAARRRMRRWPVVRADRAAFLNAHLQMLWSYPGPEELRQIPRLELVERPAESMADLLDGRALAPALARRYRGLLLVLLTAASAQLQKRGALSPRMAASLRAHLDLLPPELGRLDPVLDRMIRLLGELRRTAPVRAGPASGNGRAVPLGELLLWAGEVLQEVARLPLPALPGGERCG
jgi:hypothetical protein